MTRRPLDPEEKAAWDRVKATVKPLEPLSPKPHIAEPAEPAPPPMAKRKRVAAASPPGQQQKRPAAPVAEHRQGLDSHWDRRLKRGAMAPDLHLDLHGLGLDHAYGRLDHAIEQAVATGARSILLVTGRARAHDRASGSGRGAIRAAIHDWLAASRHAGHIAAVRGAHPRHGGDGALYIILKRGR